MRENTFRLVNDINPQALILQSMDDISHLLEINAGMFAFEKECDELTQMQMYMRCLLAILFLDDMDRLRRVLGCMDGKSALLRPLLIEKGFVSSFFNNKAACAYDGAGNLISVLRDKHSAEINLLELLYFKDISSGEKFDYLSLAFDEEVSSIEVWDCAYQTIIQYDDGDAIDFLYTKNEYHCALKWKEYLELALSKKRLCILRWMHEKGLDINPDNDPFNLLNSNNTNDVARGVKLIMDGDLASLISSAREKKDIDAIISLRNLSILDIISNAEDANALNIILDS
tara:strand:+ start:16559 stop:17416 length:858 start_codon:yes stop_codon:yes gene_type:complete